MSETNPIPQEAVELSSPIKKVKVGIVEGKNKEQIFEVSVYSDPKVGYKVSFSFNGKEAMGTDEKDPFNAVANMLTVLDDTTEGEVLGFISENQD